MLNFTAKIGFIKYSSKKNSLTAAFALHCKSMQYNLFFWPEFDRGISEFDKEHKMQSMD